MQPGDTTTQDALLKSQPFSLNCVFLDHQEALTELLRPCLQRADPVRSHCRLQVCISIERSGWFWVILRMPVHGLHANLSPENNHLLNYSINNYRPLLCVWLRLILDFSGTHRKEVVACRTQPPASSRGDPHLTSSHCSGRECSATVRVNHGTSSYYVGKILSCFCLGCLICKMGTSSPTSHKGHSVNYIHYYYYK